LLSPSLTFKGLAEVVAMHLGVISGNWLAGGNVCE
jgi:hypothetical protein